MKCEHIGVIGAMDIVERLLGMLIVLGFNDMLPYDHGAKILQGVVDHSWHGTVNNRSFKHVVGIAFTTFWKEHDFDLGFGKELFRMVAEHHGSNVLDVAAFGWAFEHVHLFKDIHHIVAGEVLVFEFAADIDVAMHMRGSRTTLWYSNCEENVLESSIIVGDNPVPEAR